MGPSDASRMAPIAVIDLGQIAQRLGLAPAGVAAAVRQHRGAGSAICVIAIIIIIIISSSSSITVSKSLYSAL